MIEVIIWRFWNDGGILFFEMMGYVDFVEYGWDFVCVGVMVVVFGVVNVVIVLVFFELIFDIGEDGGYFYFEFFEFVD